MIVVPPPPKALDPIINRLSPNRNHVCLTKLSFSLNWPVHMHKWCFPAVLRWTSKYRPWWSEIRRRWTGGRSDRPQRAPPSEIRIRRPASVWRSVYLGRTCPLAHAMPASAGRRPQPQAKSCGARPFCSVTCGAGDRLRPTVSRSMVGWPRRCRWMATVVIMGGWAGPYWSVDLFSAEPCKLIGEAALHGSP